MTAPAHSPTCRCDLCREEGRLRRLYDERVKLLREYRRRGEAPALPTGPSSCKLPAVPEPCWLCDGEKTVIDLETGRDVPCPECSG